MSQRLILRPEAQKDVAEAAEWYDQQRAGLSLRVAQRSTTRLPRSRKILGCTLRSTEICGVPWFVGFLSVSSMLPGPTGSLWWQFYALRETLAFGAPVSQFAKAKHAFDRPRNPAFERLE